MKKIFSILTIGLLLVSCDETEVKPVTDPNDFPLVSFELTDPSQQGTVIPANADDGTIAVSASMSKPSKYTTGITAVQTGGTAVEGEDFEVSGTTIPAYTTSTTTPLMISVIPHPFPEEEKTVELQVGIEEGSDGEQYSLMYDPATNPLEVSFTIGTAHSPDALTVGLDWNEEQAVDIDMVLLDANGDELAYQATADVPEISQFLTNAAPDGTYYISIQPYEVITPQWEYTFGISEPNGDLTTFTGVFDGDNLGAYTADMSPTLGEVYRLVKIVKNGSDYTMTELP
jgi:hypothetical protein